MEGEEGSEEKASLPLVAAAACVASGDPSVPLGEPLAAASLAAVSLTVGVACAPILLQ